MPSWPGGPLLVLKNLPTGNTTMRSALGMKRGNGEDKLENNIQNLMPHSGNKVLLRPISCYTASRVSEVVEDISLDEKLVRCDYQDDVCFGKVGSQFSISSHR